MSLATNPPRQQRTRDSLEKILVAGLDVLGSKGWDGFTIAAVAKRAGVGTTAIYRRFEDKEAFLIALMHRWNQDSLRTWGPVYRALARSDLDLPDLIREFVGELAAVYRRHQKLMRVFTARAAVDPRVNAVGDQTVATMAAEFETALLAHREQFRCVDPEVAVAMCFQTSLDSCLRLVMFGRQAHPELDWDRLVDELSAMMLAYLVADQRAAS